jgi:hypothetical protein
VRRPDSEFHARQVNAARNAAQALREQPCETSSRQPHLRQQNPRAHQRNQRHAQIERSAMIDATLYTQHAHIDIGDAVWYSCQHQNDEEHVPICGIGATKHRQNCVPTDNDGGCGGEEQYGAQLETGPGVARYPLWIV